MGTLIEWYWTDLIQSVGAELCAAAKAAVTELCRLTEEQDWELPALAENWSRMASGGDVSKRCRKMVDLNRYTFLYDSMRWPVPKTRHTHLRPAQELRGRAWHRGGGGLKLIPWMGVSPTRDKVVLATPEPADTHRVWPG